ncbi:nicotinate phosphoribosyltransferase [Campylobacter majalis]|uniref:nicotinate phosphoribosyltransferase n=1 Tax=Campylobacter majalis TaxID=2790656 RepID=UPI003D69C2FC
MIDEVKLKECGKISRLSNKTFKFDERIGHGFYTAEYFKKVRNIITKHQPNQTVTMQWFERKDNIMLCGIDEALAMIKEYGVDTHELEIFALDDGDMISAYEPVLKVSGKYENFGYLENVIDAVLARRSSVATNAFRAKKACQGKTIFCMADRQDDIVTQMGDGYACYVAGIRLVATDALGAWWGAKGQGTMPHALIQMCGGDVIRACEIYHDTYPDEPMTALVDYNNDVVTDALRVARVFGDKLSAVRVDTSANLIDKYFIGKDINGFDAHGVCKELIFALRDALDRENFSHVKIVVSSGFTPEKIQIFESLKVPVDVYGVGSFITRNDTVGFTGDLVELNGKPQAKYGRKNISSNRLKKVIFD